MKILKVKIIRTQGGGKTSYTYPPEYDSKKFTVIIYETQITGKMDKVVSRGNDHEFVIGVVQDADAPAFLANSDIVELTRAEAETFIDVDIDKAESSVIDVNKVVTITAKAVSGKTLTKKEKDAIDPTSSEIGINQGRTLRKALDDYGV